MTSLLLSKTAARATGRTGVVRAPTPPLSACSSYPSADSFKRALHACQSPATTAGMIIMRRTVSAAAPAHRPIKRAAMMATSAAAAANADAAANAANATATPSIGSDLYAAQQTSSVWRTLHNPPPLLSHLRVVLVQPKSPENIGAACRALANFECPDLVVVAPRTALDPREDGRVAAVACGEAVRSGMRVVDTLEEALSDCAGSVGLTRRGGATRVTHESLDALEAAFPGTVLPPQSAADAAASPPIALVFGREESGLTESELRLCSHACAIPTGRVHSSMNLSAAVAVTLAWLFARRAGVAEAAAAVAASGGEGKDREQPSVASASVAANPGLERSAAGDPNQQQGFRPASAAELEALLDKAAALALAAGESPDESSGGGNRGTHGRRRKAQGHLRAVLQRARATAWEARSLHGYLSAALKAAGVEDERAALEEARSRRRAWQQEQRRDREGPAGGGGGGGGGDDQQQQ